MTLTHHGRRLLVVGGTGMLYQLCTAVPPQDLILAARFVSHREDLAKLPAAVLRVPLDYKNAASMSSFTSALAEWNDLICCVLWIHSVAQDFSKKIIETLSHRSRPPHIVQVFGSHGRPNEMSDYAKKFGINFTVCQLGSVKTPTGERWLTHLEISEQVACSLPGPLSNLRVSKHGNSMFPAVS